MSYALSHIGEAAAATVPPPDPTSQALTLLAVSALPCLPIAFGIAGGMYVGKGQSAVSPVVGGLVGALVSFLWLRSDVVSGNSSVVPRVTA
jgi:hypothetical protein